MTLDEYLAAAAQRRFQWGVHDCCTFAADAAWILTGRDPIAPLRGWSDETTAAITLRAHFGTTDLLDVMTALAPRLGLTPVAPTGAEPLFFVSDYGGVRRGRYLAPRSLGFGYQGTLFVPAARGLTPVPAESVLGAWRF